MRTFRMTTIKSESIIKANSLESAERKAWKTIGDKSGLKVVEITSLVNEVAEAIDCNDHTGALLLVAQFVMDFELVEALEQIQREQDEAGYTPRPLMSRRDAVTQTLRERHEELCKVCRV